MIESVDGRTDFSSRSSVWQLTPKGMHLLSRFCQRNGIHQRHVNELLDSPRNVMNLVILERDPETDEIVVVHDKDRGVTGQHGHSGGQGKVIAMPVPRVRSGFMTPPS